MDGVRWRDLPSEPGVASALDHAGPRPGPDADQNTKRRWSERFADGCAVAFADAFRRCDLGGKTVRPTDLRSGTEPLTPLGGATRKRIDVTVVDAMLGLEIGVSLKGLNFRDAKSGNFDKNLTGRLYELGDEVRVVHEHLPHAFMAGVFFLPLAATADKGDGATSSFAHSVQRLRERTGRLDAALAGHAARCDAGFVCLYSDDDASGARRGAARFLDVASAPPRRGRPVVSATLSLPETAATIVDRAIFRETTVWGDPEPDLG
jgi:hypothetical protein